MDPGYYRGISLLSHRAKVLEKLLLLRLEEIRPGLSSNHTALILQEAVCSVTEQKLKAFVAFLDAQKAFDSVRYAGLLVKLHQRGISGHADLASHQPMVPHHPHPSYEKVNAPVRTYSAGSTSGSILSPLLYSIFVNELLDILLEMNINEVFI